MIETELADTRSRSSWSTGMLSTARCISLPEGRVVKRTVQPDKNYDYRGVDSLDIDVEIRKDMVEKA